MDLAQFRTFLAIAEEGNLSRAATRVHLSQPAVSGQLKLLEEEFGLRLFDRTPKGMVLTGAGMTILADVKRTLNAAGEVAQRVLSLKENPVEVFRLGTISEPTILRIAKTLLELSKQNKNAQFVISQGISGKIIDALLNDAVDAGYVIGEVNHARLRVISLAPVVLRVVLPNAYRHILERTAFRPLGDLPWISTPPDCSFHRIMGRMFEREGIAPSIVMKADQETTLAEMVRSGIGVTLLREDIAFQAEARGDLCVWRSSAECSELNFVYPSRRENDGILRSVIAAVRRSWNLDD